MTYLLSSGTLNLINSISQFLVSPLARCDSSSHVSVRGKKMSGRTEKVTLLNAFLQAGLTDLDEIWHDGRS